MRISRLAMVTVAVGLLVSGFALGRAVTDFQANVAAPASPSPSTRFQSALPQMMPVSDVDGADFDDLPRYPGAVRTGYEVRDGQLGEETRVEYLATGSVEDVRSFYRQAFVDHGWIVVDLQLAYGELRYLLGNGDRDAVVDIESRGEGVVEIDLDVVSPAPAATETSTAPPTPQPTAPPAPLPSDDDGSADEPSDP